MNDRGQRDVLEAALGDLLGMLDEAPADARGREQRLLMELAPDTPVVLFGAGNLGRRTLSLLRAGGRDAAAFVDNAPSLWGAVVDGIPVLTPDDATSRFATDGLAIVTIWRAEGGHDFLATRDRLWQSGWTHVESFIPLFWGLGADALPYITIDLPTKLLAARDGILAAAELWADDRSLLEYVAQVRWRLSGDFATLSPPVPNQYFAEGIVSLREDEVFVDCGAFTGDTLLDLAARVRSWRAYHAFEPDPSSYAELEAAVATLPVGLADRVLLHQAATSDRRSTAHFNASGLGSASLAAGGTYEVECIPVDDVVVDPTPTFIKMDIEGAESAALRGCSRTIENGLPLLAIAAYHKQADLWELPIQIHEMAPAYRMFLRPHVAEGFDTVLYALPPERTANG